MKNRFASENDLVVGMLIVRLAVGIYVSCTIVPIVGG